MELKRLEIKGFKSFADRTIINFGANVIGIVGPNGCGKSNVIDAIRWVLGEQSSAVLRSDKMSNVIFNGTKQRKPSGLAEVSLTFENTRHLIPTEFNTVTVTRMLFRTGESEYRLNGVVCRLKDIATLFLDTGIGSNSYAIIALGMVDDLLNDREQSRRKLFEQAAGISKYKVRKTETLTRLKATEEDLTRVDDLLHEIEANLKKLERQAKRAKKFLELKEAYKAQSIALGVAELADRKGNYEELETQLRTSADQLLTIDAALASAEARLQEDKTLILEKEQRLADRQKDLNRIVGRLRSGEHDQKMLRERLYFMEQNRQQLLRTIGEAQAKQRELEQTYQQTAAEEATEQTVESTYQAQLNQARQRTETAQAQHAAAKQTRETLFHHQQTTERQGFQLEKQLAVNASQVENLERNAQNAAAILEKRRQEMVATEAQRSKYSEQAKILREHVAALEASEGVRQQAIENWNRRVEQLRDDIAQTNRKLDATRNEFQLTKSFVESLEGFPESIKFLSKNAHWKSDAPLVSDILYCEEAHRVAIENYLGNYLNYYVVPDAAAALQAIRLLHQSQKGRANFFLLNELPAAEGLSAAAPPTGSIRADAVVTTDSIYQPLVAFLLGNVFLAAAEASLQTSPSATASDTVLAHDGSWVRGRATFAGGSVGLFEGKKIGRKKNLERLAAQLEALQQNALTLQNDWQHAQNEIKKLKANDPTAQIRTNQRAVEQLERDLHSLKARLESFETFEQDNRRQQSLYQRDIETLRTENHALTNQLTTLKATLEVSKRESEAAERTFKTIADQLSEASNAANQANIALIRQQNRVKSLKQARAFIATQQTEVAKKLLSSQEELTKNETESQTIRQSIREIEGELAKLYAERTDSQKQVADAEQHYYTIRQQIADQENALRTVSRQRQTAQNEILRLKDQFNDIKQHITNILERLRIEFAADPADLFQRSPEPNTSKAQLQAEVEKIRDRIATYGDVNPLAVEAFNEMKQRFDFIHAQRTDLANAQATLLQTIQQIEQTATERFLNAFDKVRDHFQHIFRQLFTENDVCDLELEEPANPLESKIRIIARPKGKRPLTINQLSGGEKTLTATALLFALYLLKPAPFCIFDEVDAPLDDANIAKFNRLIKEFSNQSQFIIVTHNKQTMAAVDIIYGVSMVEQGVSQVVPVDFRHLQ